MLLPGRLRSRLIVCVMAVMVQERTGAASRRRPCTPGSGQQHRRCAVPSTYPAGFGSGRGSVRAKHGPQPASMRAAPAFRERLSDVEAATPAVSVAQWVLTAGCWTVGRVRRSRHPAAAPCLMASPGGAALTGPTGEPVRAPASGSVPDGIARWRCAYRACEVSLRPR